MAEATDGEEKRQVAEEESRKKVKPEIEDAEERMWESTIEM